MSKWLYGIIFLLCVFLYAYIRYGFYVQHEQQLDNRKKMIVCTTSIIGDAVRNIVGDCMHVVTLMGPDVDPHLYRVKEGDVHLLAHADVVIYNGLHLEGKMVDVLQVLPHVRVHAAAEVLKNSHLITTDAGVTDPHVWHHVGLWRIVVEQIAKVLIEVDPEHHDEYMQRARLYDEKLAELDAWVKKYIESLPLENRTLITAHDAFHYFARGYAFEVFGLQGISTDADISTRDVQSLAALIVERAVKSIFVESSIPERNINAVQHAVRVLGWDVQTGGMLYSDALGHSGSGADTYESMIHHNVTTIVTALR